MRAGDGIRRGRRTAAPPDSRTPLSSHDKGPPEQREALVTRAGDGNRTRTISLED